MLETASSSFLLEDVLVWVCLVDDVDEAAVPLHHYAVRSEAVDAASSADDLHVITAFHLSVKPGAYLNALCPGPAQRDLQAGICGGDLSLDVVNDAATVTSLHDQAAASSTHGLKLLKLSGVGDKKIFLRRRSDYQNAYDCGYCKSQHSDNTKTMHSVLPVEFSTRNRVLYLSNAQFYYSISYVKCQLYYPC
jgi:hypothetical protein